MTRLISVVIHDVAPANWQACRRVMDAVAQVAPIPITLLVVPRFHLQARDAAFENQLTHLLSSGHELALHGYSHLDPGEPLDGWDHIRRRIYTDGEGEFCALSAEAAELRLRAGLRWFEERGWPVSGFVAPAWLLSAGSWEVLHASTLRYTTTLSAVHALPQRQHMHSSALVFSTRSRWRRVLSLPRNHWVSLWWRTQPLVRLELHPSDADHPRIRQLWMRKLAQLLEQREAVTLADAVSRLWPANPGRVVCQGAGPLWQDTTIDFTRTSHADRSSQMVQR